LASIFVLKFLDRAGGQLRSELGRAVDLDPSAVAEKVDGVYLANKLTPTRWAT
jgi:hypothetical protein